MKISAIIPCFNEELNITPAYEQVTKALLKYEGYEIIFIDDGSTDDTLSLIKEIASKDDRVKYISFTRNFGVEAATRYGYLYATYEWCIHYDADLQWPPEETEKLVEKANKGYDAVFGIRNNRQDKPHRILGTKVQQFIARKLLRIELPKGASTFRLIKTSLARKVIFRPTGTAYFIATLPLITRNYTTVEINHNKRLHGKSKFGLRKMVNHSCELFWGFSDRMLNFSAAAFIISVIAFAVVMVLTLINPTHGSILLQVFLCVMLIILLLSKALSDQYLKYIAPKQPHHDAAYVKQSNIEACVRERII